MAAGSWYPGGGIVYVEGQEIENGSTSGHTGEEPREARAEKVDAELAIRASTLAPEDLDSSVWYNVRTSFSSGWVRLSPLAMVSRIVPLSSISISTTLSELPFAMTTFPFSGPPHLCPQCTELLSLSCASTISLTLPESNFRSNDVESLLSLGTAW